MKVLPPPGKYKRFRYGEHESDVDHELCPDCTTEMGELHWLGCDQERCPRCGDQLISCGCAGDEQLINEAHSTRPPLPPHLNPIELERLD